MLFVELYSKLVELYKKHLLRVNVPPPATKEEAKAIEEIKVAVAQNPKIDPTIDKELKDLSQMRLED